MVMKLQEDKTFEYSYDDMSSNKIMAALSVIPALFWLKFLVTNSKYVNFYANQGLMLLILGVILNIVSTFVTKIAFLNFLTGWIFSIVNLLLTVTMIVQIVNALRLKAKTLPFIGDVTII